MKFRTKPIPKIGIFYRINMENSDDWYVKDLNAIILVLSKRKNSIDFEVIRSFTKGQYHPYLVGFHYSISIKNFQFGYRETPNQFWYKVRKFLLKEYHIFK